MNGFREVQRFPWVANLAAGGVFTPRMVETAAHLLDCVLPVVPTRQWVLSLPFPLRYRLAYHRTLPTPLLAAFLRAVFASLRRRARECYGGDAEPEGEDELSRDNPVMAALYAAAVQGRIAMGADAGQRIVRLGNAALAAEGADVGATLGGCSPHAPRGGPAWSRRLALRKGTRIVPPLRTTTPKPVMRDVSRGVTCYAASSP